MARPALCLWFVCCVTAAATSVSAQTTTVITHGFQATGAFPDWTLAMGEAIRTRAGGGTLLRYNPTTGAWDHVSGSQNPNNALILAYDWSDDSAWIPGIDDDRVGTAHGAADALFAALVAPALPAAYGSEGALTRASGTPRTLHFIGHSRGACVQSETVRRLTLAGFVVDHVTALDPHPVGPTAGLGDPDPVVWEGVTWAESFWRADGCDVDFGCLGFDFDGQPVVGARNRDLGFLDGLGFFDIRLTPCTLEHLQVHAWYHGTIDLAATTDGCCSIPRNDWYVGNGAQEGYFFAAAGGGSASRPCGPTGGCSDAGRVVPTAVPALVNGDFEFGAGQDGGWRWHGGGGPATIVEAAGNAFLQLEPGAAERTHNWFIVPAAATELVLDWRVVGADSGAALEARLIDAAGVAHVVGSLAVATTGPWQLDEALPLPASIVPGDRYLLQLRLAPVPTIATVDVDNVRVEAGGPTFLRSDCNDDGATNVADAVSALSFLFGGGSVGCDAACDANGDANLDISDPVYQLANLFAGGAAPPAPYPSCGVDPGTGLSCAVFATCP